MHARSRWHAVPSDIELIEIRNSIVGPQAYIVGTRLQVWMTDMRLRGYAGDLA